MKSPRKRCVSTVLAALLLLTQGCTHGEGDRDDDEGPPIDYVRFSIATDPATLNPVTATNEPGSIEQELARLSFEPFVDYDSAGRPVPALLSQIPTRSNGGLSADERTITYRLRPNARWSDGVPITSDDVVFTFQQIQSLGQASSSGGYDRIDAIYATDPHTVVVHLREAWAPAVLSYFSYGASPYVVIPKHASGEFTGLPAVVDGPFRPVSWNRGQAMWYVGNPVYWRGRPVLDMVEIRIQSQSDSVGMLQSNYLDWMPVTEPQEMPLLKRLPHVAFVTIAGHVYAYHHRLTGFAPSPLLPTWNAFFWRSNWRWR